MTQRDDRNENLGFPDPMIFEDRKSRGDRKTQAGILGVL